MANSVKYPGTVTQGTAGYTWDAGTLDVTGLGADDTDYALCTGAGFDINIITNEANLSNFSMAVPAGSAILGIVVEVRRARTAGTSCVDNVVQLTKVAGTPLGNNLADTTTNYGTEATISYGSATDLTVWGATFTAAEVNASGFGMQFRAKATANNVDILVDFIRITVYYAIAVTVAGALASSGVLVKEPKKVTAGTLASAGVFVKELVKVWTGVLAPVGVFVKRIDTVRAGILAMSGAIAVTRIATVAVAGILATSGAIKKVAQTVRAGTLATSGVLAKTAVEVRAGTLASSGVLAKVPKKVFTGTLATTGILIKSTSKAFASTVATTGTLVKKPLKIFVGTLATAGTWVKAVQKVHAGTLTSTGVLVKQPRKIFAGTLTSAGVIAIQLAAQTFYVTVAGTLAIAGTLSKRINTAFSGTLTTAGVLSKRASIVRAGILSVTSTVSMLVGLLVRRGTITVTATGSAAGAAVLTTRTQSNDPAIVTARVSGS